MPALFKRGLTLSFKERRGSGGGKHPWGAANQSRGGLATTSSKRKYGQDALFGIKVAPSPRVEVQIPGKHREKATEKKKTGKEGRVTKSTKKKGSKAPSKGTSRQTNQSAPPSPTNRWKKRKKKSMQPLRGRQKKPSETDSEQVIGAKDSF